MSYFFDSYAIIELILGNENYLKFKEELINTSTTNLMEIYYFLLRTYDKETADFWMKKSPKPQHIIAPKAAKTLKESMIRK